MIRRFRHDLLIEFLLMLAVLASLAWMAWQFSVLGYLPQPFIFNTYDTFMDWFNTAFWAVNPGAFTVWRAVYPPLSFVFLDVFSLHGCYLHSAVYARDCDWLGRVVIYAFYVLDAVLVWLSFRRNDPSSAPMRTVAFVLGLPLLYTLERGNLILVAFACFVVAHGPLAVAPRWRALASAATINFKPYLLVPVLAHGFKRDWRPLEWAGIATLGLYLVTLALVGSGTPMELLSNTANWVQFQGSQVWGEINYSTSYAPFMEIRTLQIPMLTYVPSRLIETIFLVVPLVIRTSQAIAVVALVAAWLQPKALDYRRIATILTAVFLVGQSPGGYAQTFLLFLVLLEPWRGPGPIVAIVCAYLLCLDSDWRFATVFTFFSDDWMSGRPVTPGFGLTLGHFARPGLVVAILWALSLDSIVKVVRAHRRHRPSLGFAAA